MSYQVTRLQDDLSFGVIVQELDPASIADEGVRRSLYDIWVREGLIIFRDLPGGGEVQVALSRVFGAPEPHPLRDPKRNEPIPELADIRYNPERGDIVRFADGTRKGGYLPWHFDLVYLPKINHGGILRAVMRAATGGDTGFLDRIAIYDALPERLKQRIEGLDAIYLFEPDMNRQRYGKPEGFVQERISQGSIETAERLKLPPVAHPLVFVQPETGRKMLNFSPWYSLGIDGMAQDEADAILHEVATYCTDESRAYFHRWDRDDMVLWDNWRMLHCATGISAAEERFVQRTTIHGDYGVGRVLARESATQAA